jgi:hypothetical protein
MKHHLNLSQVLLIWLLSQTGTLPLAAQQTGAAQAVSDPQAIEVVQAGISAMGGTAA